MRSTNLLLEQAMERLSSGKRINTAADDAAGMAVATRMTSIVQGQNMATRNAQDGISFMQTTEGAMGTIINLLQRIRELSVQANNGTNSASDLKSINEESKAMIQEIDHVSKVAEFNGVKVLDGTVPSINLHISHLSADFISVALHDAKASGGTNASMLAIAALDLTAVGGASDAITKVDAALETINAWRGDLGAMMNRMNYTIDSLSVNSTNTQASRARIEDSDMAAEVSIMTKEKILYQSSVSMLTHANQNPQMVLQLLQA